MCLRRYSLTETGRGIRDGYIVRYANSRQPGTPSGDNSRSPSQNRYSPFPLPAQHPQPGSQPLLVSPQPDLKTSLSRPRANVRNFPNFVAVFICDLGLIAWFIRLWRHLCWVDFSTLITTNCAYPFQKLLLHHLLLCIWVGYIFSRRKLFVLRTQFA